MKKKTQAKSDYSWFRYKAAAVRLIITAAVVGYVCILLVLYYDTSSEVQTNYLERHKNETEKRALLVDNFFAERKDDLKNLAASREIAVYFENKALGMSDQYGLNLSLPAIHGHFHDVLQSKRYKNSRIYTRLVLLDKKGRSIVDSASDRNIPADGKAYVDPYSRDAAAVWVMNNELIVSIAYYFKNRHEAQLVAWIDPEVVFKGLIGDALSHKDRTWLVLKNTYPPQFLSKISPNPPEYFKQRIISPGSLPKEATPIFFNEAMKNGGKQEWIGLFIPIQGTDFLYVRETLRELVLGKISPLMQLSGMISLAALILGIGIFNIMLNVKTQNLKERLEESLHSEIDIYKTLAEKSFTGVFVIQDGVFRYITENAAHTFGHDIASLVETKREMIVFPEDREIFSRMAQDMLEGTRKAPYEYRVVTKKNEINWIMETVSPIHFSGRPAILGNCIDVTEKRRKDVLELHALKLQSIGQLSAGIAHEINTPVQFVMDNIYFMKTSFQEILDLVGMLGEVTEENKSDLSLIRDLCARVHAKKEAMDLDFLREEIPQAILQSMEGLERVTRIVMAMREFSHPGGEEKKDIDVNKSIESTMNLTRNEWKHTADLVADLDPDLPMVQGYPTDFNQVLLNMIVNAAQSIEEKLGEKTREKGLIEISTRRKDDNIEICIRDTGTGIPPEAQSRIFDPFFTTKEVGKGTGQGLTLAQYVIVNKHGGNISFETKSGEGTTFYIQLPVTE